MNITGQPITLTVTFSEHLLKDARQCMERGELEYAVILSHAACDLHTEGVLRVLLARKCPDPAVAELLGSFMQGRSTSLDNNRAREVYGVLTGRYPAGLKRHRIEPVPWWADWDASRNIRHDVAHRGMKVTRDQAASSIHLAERYIEEVSPD